ncbi:MAG: nucleotide exchange factor GrpE [Oscillospiraceae bacterium]|jgi:molecular chaperone GrpE|nr:nucleotide exchange factor GrpE [Oscillospiraceae bacterium]
MAKKQPETAPPPESEQEQAEAEVLDPVVAELEAMEGELAQSREQLLRLAAEYDNYRKRSQREREESYQIAKADALKPFLPVLDNFERACVLPAAAAEQDFAEFRKGVDMIYSQLAGVFAALGAEAFGEAGDDFDPALHMAVLHGEDENFGKNAVADVFQKGWRLGERVLRVATVKAVN